MCTCKCSYRTTTTILCMYLIHKCSFKVHLHLICECMQVEIIQLLFRATTAPSVLLTSTHYDVLCPMNLHICFPFHWLYSLPPTYMCPLLPPISSLSCLMCPPVSSSPLLSELTRQSASPASQWQWCTATREASPRTSCSPMSTSSR